MRFLLTLIAACGYASVAFADPLPNTQPLTFTGDPAAAMVAGLHKYLDRETVASVEKRKQFWKPDFSSPEAYAKSVESNRERLKKLLGVVDKRLPPAMELVATTDQPALAAETEKYKVYAVRWPVLPGVDGEGLLMEPTGNVIANVVALPHPIGELNGVPGIRSSGPLDQPQLVRRLAENGCRVVVLTLLDRRDDWSNNPRLNKSTNQSLREFVYRMAFEMGRHIIGYEVKKVLAAVDWFHRQGGAAPVAVVGYGDGGVVAMFAAAVDERIASALVFGYGGPDGSELWKEPIDRNVWGLVREFGPAEMGSLIVPRHLNTAVDLTWGDMGPRPPSQSRSGAAPGTLRAPKSDDLLRQIEPLIAIYRRTGIERGLPRVIERDADDTGPLNVLLSTTNEAAFGRVVPPGPPPKDRRKNFDPAARQKRQFDQLVAYTQKLWRDSEFARNDFFWKKTDSSSREKWQISCDPLRAYFWEEVIGKLPPPTLPPNPRSRQVYDEPKWTGHEVMLDLYPDVFAYGILLTPKDLKPSERRPVVVCQHGLEGTPRSCIDAERRTIYNRFAAKLADLGYIVYCPQNPYYGENTFRQVQRKANPLKLSLFSYIIQQHATTIDWLVTLPYVDKDRIAFYGLSYGGKTAMRVPAVEPRYCLSICSGDFNEWIGKNVSVDLDRSYMWTREYEMPEFDLGNTFNYAEMAGLIAPRPFMVERGHRDGVGTDEMVAYEYAKVRRLYATLKIPERTTIEFFEGGHEIRAVGTFAFLKQHLGWPR